MTTPIERDARLEAMASVSDVGLAIWRMSQWWTPEGVGALLHAEPGDGPSLLGLLMLGNHAGFVAAADALIAARKANEARVSA